MKASDTEREMALCLELETAIRLIQAGLGQLQQMSAANDFYHLPLLTLASGFERFMKVTICLHHFQDNGEYPGIDYLKKVGHDLDGLLSRIQENCFTEDYRKGLPADFKYLETEELRCLVRLLGDFARSARYHYLDVVAGAGKLAGSPEDRWNAIEVSILTKTRPDLLTATNVASDEAFVCVSTEMVKRLERFTRALARLFTVGNLSQKSKIFTGVLKPFLFLRDEDLGKTQYSPWGKDAS